VKGARVVEGGSKVGEEEGAEVVEEEEEEEEEERRYGTSPEVG